MNVIFLYKLINISMKIRNIISILIFLICTYPGSAQRGSFNDGQMLLTYSKVGITEIISRNDKYNANAISGGGHLGSPLVKYKYANGDWLDLFQGESRLFVDEEKNELHYTDSIPGMPMYMKQSFKLEDGILDWNISIKNQLDFPVIIGDLAIPFPWKRPEGRNPEDIFEKGFTKHHYISGDASFIFFSKPSGNPPFLILTVKPGTQFEYFNSEGGYKAFIHSFLSGNNETRGNWRQKHTSVTLNKKGIRGDSLSYGFRLQWTDSYDGLRNILYKEGLLDIRVVPGMTVPNNLFARFSIHTQKNINSINAEFPDQTIIQYLGEPKPDHHIYEVKFHNLGENMITISYGNNQNTYLEFFSTEDLETLIKKRSSFIVNKQQHVDKTKWYDGLYSVYDMKNKVLRGPDNTDGYDHWWGYVLACDDPALCKAPYVAAKNVKFPDDEEISSVEYYIENFVWGGLQRTDEEKPYPYGIYGTPNWKVNRDPLARAGIKNVNLDKMNVWRSYDYPHMVMLYFHMFEIAEKYPDKVKNLNAEEYLERAWQTARAYFIYPYEILPWYDTYKWGCYNELVILELISVLENKGYEAKANFLRGEWEKKAKYFIYDDEFPYRSEYATDRTAFESAYALSKYASLNKMEPDTLLWWDKKLEKWYSHPNVNQKDALEFMEKQNMANLSCRGWLETKYYLLGSDFTSSSDRHTLSYMAKMGGWAILDYALNFSKEPYDYIQLGYASYLSSWALMNSGTKESNYGFWYPGVENDGAMGWAFTSEKFARAWIRKDVPRGAWHYDGEADLGNGAAIRTATTILTNDPLFGWFCYGGIMKEENKFFEILPRDGIRQRLDILSENKNIHIELDRDGYSKQQSIIINKAFNEIAFKLENRTNDQHITKLKIKTKSRGNVRVKQANKWIDGKKIGAEWCFDLFVNSPNPDIKIFLK